MDFVVVGLGIGALAVLLGLGVRDLGPFFRRIPRDGSMPWAEVADRVSWGRRCRAAGLVLAIAGAAVCLVTGLALLARASDSTGMWTVLVALVAAVIAIAAWAFRYQTLSRAPIAPLLEDSTKASAPTQPPPRKSALAGIRSRRPNLGRNPSAPEAAPPTDDDPLVVPPPDRHAADTATPMGPLTVDPSGAMRRTPIGVQPDPAAPAPRPARPAQPNRPNPTRPTTGDPRSGGRRGPGADPYRR